MTAAATMAETNVVAWTVMFTDIVGFTEFTAVRGDGDALALLSRQERIVQEELAGGGRIVKELGDGLMLWFDDPCDAINTGLRLQERFEEETSDDDMPLWVRIGMHTGRQSRRGNDLVGHDVNVASRIVNLANSGEVLASESTVRGAEGKLTGVQLEQLGPVVMKGIPAPVNLFRAERVG